MRKDNMIILSVRIIILITMITSIIFGVVGIFNNRGADHNFTNAFTCFITLIITFVPSLLISKTALIVPAALQVIFVIFTFLAMYLGNMFGYYSKFWWWDSMLHSLSGIMLGILGFLLFYTINKSNKYFFHINNISIMIFGFCFAMTCGVFWEFFEFAGDYFFGLNSQRSVYVTNIIELEKYINKWGRFMDPGLLDTMKDLIVDAIGALISVVVGFLFVKHHDNDEDKIKYALGENKK